jgi:hypothetical protein
MGIVKNFNKLFRGERKYELIYIVVDVHNTILKPSFEKEETFEYFKHAKEVLQKLSKIPYVRLIMWTGCYPDKLEMYRKHFEENGIHFDYINENPECQNSVYACLDKKFYFDIGFDDEIPEDTRDALIRFVYWVEDHYYMPVTLWVDFKYRHYLVTRDKRRVGYKFYWVDFNTYPFFENTDDIPVIELPVRTEQSAIEDILRSFIQGITMYFAWMSNINVAAYTPDDDLVDEILQTYLCQLGGKQ